MKKIIATGLLLFLGTTLLAQPPRDSSDITPYTVSSMNINLLGDASLISLHYEGRKFVRSAVFITGKVGLGFNEEFRLCLFGPCSPPQRYLTIPHHVTANFGGSKHYFELGMGGTIISGSDRGYFLYPIIGYRRQPLAGKKVSFRVFGQLPVVHPNNNNILFSPVGISLGVNTGIQKTP